MTRDEAWSIYAAAVADVLERDPDEIEHGLQFREDLDIDSLGVFELVLELEEAFDLELPEEDAEKITTTTEGFELVCRLAEIG